MRIRAGAVAVLILAGCGKVRSGDIPKVRYGSDSCARCGMIVSEERFAAGYVDQEGKTVAFDDVGEFLKAAAERPAIIAISFVHDAESGQWVRASRARFVEVPSLATPMGSGYAAFADEGKAAAFVRERGGAARVLSIERAIAGG